MAKFKAAARFIQHPKTLTKLADFMINDILGEDEQQFYNSIYERIVAQ